MHDGLSLLTLESTATITIVVPRVGPRDITILPRLRRVHRNADQRCALSSCLSPTSSISITTAPRPSETVARRRCVRQPRSDRPRTTTPYTGHLTASSAVLVAPIVLTSHAKPFSRYTYRRSRAPPEYRCLRATARPGSPSDWLILAHL